ncbi:MAG: hypothetical protein M3Z06_13725 [Actinomycetota bacterium]|nr:hypothetical protein [Actinomycetota bacterium]
MRCLIPIAIIATLALAGCGSSSQKSPATGGAARSTELSYFGSGSPFVMSLSTSPGATSVKTGLSLVNTFPGAAFGEQAIISKLQQVGIDYQTDIKPLFGNPIMFGAASSTLSGSARNNVMVVWVTKDATKLAALIKKIPGLSPGGTHDGATLYGLGSTAALAVAGATLVIGSSGPNVNAALDRHASGSGFSSAEYARLSNGLPQDTLMSAFGDLTTVLSATRAAKARSVPWVGAIRGYAASISATGAGVSFQYRLDTSGRTLGSAQLPIAPGTAAPNLAGSLPITVGVANPAQIATFAEGAEQSTSPAGWAKYQQRQAAAKAKTGYSLDDLFKQLTGNLILSSDTHTTMGRVAVADASQVSQIVTKLATQPAAFFAHSRKTKSLGGGFYSIQDGKTTLTIGVAGGQLLVGKASVAQLRAFAGQPAAPAAGAHGSIAFRVALLPLLRLTLKKAPPQIAQVILSALGDISGWTQASGPALTGNATLAVK